MKISRQLLCILGIAQLLSFHTTFAQKLEVQRMDPSNWFVGMKNPSVQLLIYGKNIAESQISLKPYAGVKIKKIQKVENPNYLFVDLEIAKTTKKGTLSFLFTKGTEQLAYSYELVQKKGNPSGVNSSDFIYLLMPDRFSNGDKTNDKFADMADTSCNRANPFLRHGGDIQGVINHLDYLKELGVTAIWMTPVIENDQPLTNEGGEMRSAYHGYGFTDHYKIDKRFGGNESYKKFVQTAHDKGFKIVQDAVYNHVGKNHWFIKDLPMKNWLNQWDNYTNTSYKDQPIFDPHGSEIDHKVTTNGWFTSFLPDLNENNPFLANYLIQHALWTVETFGIDAWRIDTYIYNDLTFMNRCNAALINEYPSIHIFGESAVNTVVSQAYFVKNKFEIPFKSNQPGGLDFVLEGAMLDALKQEYSWDGGVNRLYTTLAQDFVYEDATKNVTFLENHDSDRYFSVIGEDFAKYKIGITWLLTTRGIPHFYYGTEILMKNFKNPSDAEVRRDFPGGFSGDSENKFTAAGRNANENEAFNFVKKLANFRKSSEAICHGKLLQFVPEAGIYVYFRYTDSQKIMVISNTNKNETELKTEKFAEILKGTKTATNIMTNEKIVDISTIKVPAMTSLVLEIGK